MNKKKIMIVSLIIFLVAGIVAIVLFIVLRNSGNGSNDEISNKEYRLIKVDSFEGTVNYSKNNESMEGVFAGQKLDSGDTIIVNADSFLNMLIDSDKHIGAKEVTKFIINATGSNNAGKVKIELLYGEALFEIENKLNDDSTFEVVTSNASLSVRGTTFTVSYDIGTNTTKVEVAEGTVEVTDTVTGNKQLVNRDESILIDSVSNNTVSDNAANNSDDNIIATNFLDSNLANALPGDVVNFGQFITDPDDPRRQYTSDRTYYCPLQWDVLENDGEKVLLVCHYFYGRHAYDIQSGVKSNRDIQDTNWEQSEMRRYLNDEYFNATFDEREKQLIVTTANNNPSSLEYHYLHSRDAEKANTNPCGVTNDKVFILGWEEILKYYGPAETTDSAPFFSFPNATAAIPYDLEIDNEYHGKYNDLTVYKMIDNNVDYGNSVWATRGEYQGGKSILCIGRNVASHTFVTSDVIYRPAIWVSIK